MAMSKSHLYPEDLRIVCSFAKAIGHPARAQIIRQLQMQGSCSVEELQKDHPITPPSLSDHLKILRKSQLVTCREKYPHTFYKAERRKIKEAKKCLEAYFHEAAPSKKRRQKARESGIQ
jgi:DNA-binding transcriptional ArsR family regulator